MVVFFGDYCGELALFGWKSGCYRAYLPYYLRTVVKCVHIDGSHNCYFRRRRVTKIGVCLAIAAGYGSRHPYRAQ